jgi:hypothetical protein
VTGRNTKTVLPSCVKMLRNNTALVLNKICSWGEIGFGIRSLIF